MNSMKRRLVLAAIALTAPSVRAQEHATTTAPSAVPPAHPASTAAPTAAPAPSPSEKFDRYSILADKNIFVRNRPATRTPGQQRTVTRRAEETMVLTGIALQEGRHVAFLEDSAARQTKRLLPGDQVAGGSIVAVNFDSVEFDANGKRIHIPVGRNLLGEIAPVAAAEPSSSQPAVASSNSPERTAADRSSNGRSRSGSSSNGNSRDSNNGRDRNSRDSRNGRDSRPNSTPPRDNLRERDPAAPPVDTAVVVPGGAAAPALPNDPNLSLEERMKLRAQQLRGETNK
jgi:hypothetical protein